MAGMDKVTRILIMYSKLLEGGKINKNSFCIDAEIGRRTFDRDIEDIRLFLSESFQGNQLVYSKTDECYQLDYCHHHKALSGMEVAFLLELLGSNRSLRKDEYVELVTSVFEAGEGSRRELLKKIADRHKKGYPEDKKEAAPLKMQWDLQQSIMEYDMVRLFLLENVQIVVSPVELWNDQTGAYLFAYDKEEELQVFPVNGLQCFKIEGKKFDKCLVENFDKLTWQEIKMRLEKARMEHEKD